MIQKVIKSGSRSYKLMKSISVFIDIIYFYQKYFSVIIVIVVLSITEFNYPLLNNVNLKKAKLMSIESY